MTRSILYSRFSPRPDEATSQANAKQLEALKAYATAQGWTVADADCFSDSALSGDDPERPGLAAAIAAVRPGSILLAYDVERIARDSGILASTMAEVFYLRGSICTVTGGMVKADDPLSRLLCTIMGALAEFQMHMIRKRSADGLRRKLQNGVLTGKNGGYPKGQPLPYGFRWLDEEARTVQPAEDEQQTLVMMHGLLAQGRDRGEIAAVLNEKGIPYRDVKWDRHAVRRVLEPGKKRVRRKRKMPR